MVSYVENGYKVNNSVITAWDVEVVEENIVLICLEKHDDEKNRDIEKRVLVKLENDSSCEYQFPSTSTLESSRGKECKRINSSNDQTENILSESSDNLNVERRSSRKRSPVNRYGKPVSHFICVNYVDANVPYTGWSILIAAPEFLGT